MASDGPLGGWRVLEVADGPAAAFCGRILADLGADVVMVEPPSGHALRSSPPLSADRVSGRFLYLSAGKRSVVPGDGASDLDDLAAAADVVVTDRGVGGFPRCRLVSVTPYGLTGPQTGDRTHPLTLFHASGEGSTLPSGLGYEMYPERPPLQLGGDIVEFDTGWNAALVAIALMHDSVSGGVGSVGVIGDISGQESELSLSRTRLNRWLNEGVCAGREGRRYGITGMLRCRDGWIQLVGMREEHWDRLAASDDGGLFVEAGLDSEEGRRSRTAELGEVLSAWCAARPKRQAAARLSEVGAPVGIYADPSDCFGDPQLDHRAFFRTVPSSDAHEVALPGPPYRFSRWELTVGPAPRLGSATGFSERQQSTPDPSPGLGRLLEGVRVLDFTWAAAGPYATLLLGFLGADVVKVESGRRPDPARRGFLMQHYSDPDRSPIFNELNLNKRSLRVDLTQPESRKIIMELVEGFDVVVDNFRPGVMDRLGYGAKALLEAHPHLVVASSSANGSTGPDAMGAGLASIFAASGGLSSQTGYPDGPPTEVSDTMDYRSGTALAVAIAAALVERRTSGRGQQIDLSSREVALSSAPDPLLAAAVGAAWPLRVGNGHRSMAPHGVFAGSEGGWLAVAVNGRDEWAGLCAALGKHEWESRFPDSDSRREAEAQIATAITQWTSSRTAPQAAAELESHGVPAAPVKTFEALARDPHLADRRVIIEVDHPCLGRQQVMRAPWLLRGVEERTVQAGPCLGDGNSEILASSPSAQAVPPGRREEVFK